MFGWVNRWVDNRWVGTQRGMGMTDTQTLHLNRAEEYIWEYGDSPIKN